MVEGIVSEPGETANEFVFITPDSSEIKNGEFVFYSEEVETSEGEAEEKKIFARVTNREQKRGLPEHFMSDPNVSPERVARTIGLNTENNDIYRITAEVIGYYNEKLNDFTNPRIVPEPGTQINLASNDDLEDYLTETSGSRGTAYIGDLLHRPENAAQIELPIDSFASTHLAILASTGSGKSYTASVLIEEMMQPDSRAAVLVMDPHGEYGSLTEMEGKEEFKEGDYSPDVKVMDPSNIKIRISELSLPDLFALLDDLSEAQEHALSKAWSNLTQGDPEHQKEEGDDERENNKDFNSEYISLNEIKEECVAVAENDSTGNALRWRLDKALNRDLFDSSENVPLTQILEPGQCTVLQLDTLSLREQQMLVSVLFKKINRKRVEYEKSGEGNLDFPVFGLLEEGHRFAPADGEARSLGPLSTILSEGRKFGIGIGIISQRPSKIDDDVLSQCMTQIIMQIQNPLDQDAVKKGVEDVGESLLSELPGLTPGQAVISGDSVNTPFLANIRNRITSHGAESLDATEEWVESWNSRNSSSDSGLGEPEGEGSSDREEIL